MSVTRASIRSELANRLGDSANAVWSTTDLNGYIDMAIRGLYPTYYEAHSDTTVAGNGPVQTLPSGARNLHYVGLIRDNLATRVRKIRDWQEGAGNAVVPKIGISGQTLVWAWTQGWDAPTLDSDPLTFPTEATEVVVLRSQIAALEHLVADRVKLQKYLALNLREAVTDQDIAIALDALHVTHDDRMKRVIALPPVEK